ncbi:alpha/beta hydrolase [Saccharopolyspora sp. NPDC049357]|uniref:alpha/beta fold hydrolase n=1 Tax=Saccharopolyspora sp. NPDC049357 TaxID=3154507 RepID=UPI0034215BDF
MTDSLAHTAKAAPTLRVATRDTSFAYRDLGPRDGVPLVFLHHFTAVIDDWDPRVIDGIAAERRVIIFDNRGVGGTPGKVPTTVEAMADDAVAFIRALGLEQVDLLGFSLGGFIAQVIAAEQPQLVRRFILSGTGPTGLPGVGQLNPRMLIDSLRGLVTLSNPKPLLFFTRTGNGKAAAEAYMARLQERAADRVRPTSILGAARQLLAISRWGARGPMDLGRISHPVLVANGEDDRMLATRGSFELAHRLPQATLTIYPDSGHGGVFQHHDRFVPQALRFLR